MCGIIGLIGSSGGVSRQQFAAARDLMHHRGPDDAGLYQAQDVYLGFRRLSILDLSMAGHQPMVSSDGRAVVVFNGEIYNYLDLRASLESTFEFKSGTDTETLLNGYLAWGWDGLLRRIDGMFAFAVWDTREQVLYAARDRAGKKPFFYADKPGVFGFASTLNALKALFPGRVDIDPFALDAYLTYQAVPAPLTLMKGFNQLPPAHQLRFDVRTGTLDVAEYWDVDYREKLDLTEEEALGELERLVRKAVRKRLMSDVPLGAFLSGGVDSSLVVSMMAQERDDPVEAVVIGFDDPAFDERRYARVVAERWGVRLHEHVLAADAVADLPEIIWQYGQPLADVSIVPTYYVARAAREHVTVILNGDGGDELFGGYARPMVARAAQHYRRWLPEPVRRMAARRLGGRNGSSGALAKRVGMLVEAGRGSAEQAFVYDRAFRSHRRDGYEKVLLNAVADHPDLLYRDVWQRASGIDDVDRALYGDFKTYLPDQLLAKMDVSSMAHSVEARSPLLDTELVEFAARIPTSLRLKGYTTKYLLKRLTERFVPREVLYRRKRGFVMPAANWLSGDLAPYLRAALTDGVFYDRGWLRPAFVAMMLEQHLLGRHDWGEQLWTLFVLEIWMRLAVDGTLDRSDSLEALL